MHDHQRILVFLIILLGKSLLQKSVSAFSLHNDANNKHLSTNKKWFFSSILAPCDHNILPKPLLASSSPGRGYSAARWAMQSNDDEDSTESIKSKLYSTVSQPAGIRFSIFMTICGALLGPFLDSYHSAFRVLEYDEPLNLILWGTENYPALTTAWWVPELFGLAGFLIGWLYVLGDTIMLQQRPPQCDIVVDNAKTNPSIPTIFLGISLFTFQYWLSGVMFATHLDRTLIFTIMSAVAATGYWTLDGTVTGFITSTATALGGPLIEVFLLSTLTGHGGYHYTDPGETGFFPLWIVPVYFLGGPAVGNLARGFWHHLTVDQQKIQEKVKAPTRPPQPCPVCNDTRCVDCPNCEGVGTYVTYGRQVPCNCCKGRGFVMCRACFSTYDEDPNDIDAIRRVMLSMPD